MSFAEAQKEMNFGMLIMKPKMKDLYKEEALTPKNFLKCG